jgi:hypothetical protein
MSQYGLLEDIAVVLYAGLMLLLIVFIILPVVLITKAVEAFDEWCRVHQRR